MYRESNEVYKICFSIVDIPVFVVVVVAAVDTDMVLEEQKTKFESGNMKRYDLRLDTEDQSLIAIGGTTVVDVGI
jgi:hypothetical protein